LRSSFRAATSSIKACLLGMRRVEALGREALDQPSRFGTRERRAVKVEVILDEQDDLDTREADVGEILQDVGVVERSSPWPLETPSIGLGAHALLQRNRPSLPVPAKKVGRLPHRKTEAMVLLGPFSGQSSKASNAHPMR
jgi:hypothetical protein